ncbi:MAG: CvpA family protein [Firmicutes bacterium]|nr:CvpA family protein [Bacillota bacterium]
MNIVDVIIVLSLLFGSIVGFKKGAISTGVSFVGLVLAIVLSAILRRPVAEFMYEHLPFLDFGGIFKGVTVLNILLYEVIAFFLVFSILQIGVGLLSKVANIIEKALDFTIVLGIPSKIIGIFVGFIETYIYVFIVMYFLTLPMFNIGIVKDSKITDKILNNTPILTNTVGGTLNAFQSVYELKEANLTKEEYSLKSLDIILKYEIADVKSVDNLIKSGKLKINDAESILDKYR